MSKIKLLKQNSKFDWWIAGIAILLSLFGLLMIYEASNVVAFRNFEDKYFFVRDQIVWLVIGLIGMIISSFFTYKKYYKLSLPLLILTILTLVAVFIPGLGIKALGARRWLNIGFLNFQPTELAKLTLILYLSAWFKEKERGRFIPFMLLLSLIVGLVILQPDLGTAIILISVSIIMYFLSGAPFWHFFLLIPLAISLAFVLSIISPYRFARIATFINPDIDPLGASYHIRQILISLGSGGLWGVGLGGSRQKYQYLPEASTDSIFAIIGEDFGFIGSTVLILVFIVFFWRIYKVIVRAPDRLGFLIGSGILALFLSQTTINLGAQVAILPLTGSPLPFVSYGGSNLIISLIASGVILNISRHSILKR